MNQHITKISLMGYMGSGKSTVAGILATKMNVPAIDLDDYINEKEGLSIPEIFASRGEIYFRKMENVYLKELLDSGRSFVLALGGGTPCYANNMEMLLKKSRSVYLRASVSTLFDRLVRERESRPMISDLSEEQLAEFIAKHLFERREFYEKAERVISIEDKSPESIAEEIIYSR